MMMIGEIGVSQRMRRKRTRKSLFKKAHKAFMQFSEYQKAASAIWFLHLQFFFKMLSQKVYSKMSSFNFCEKEIASKDSYKQKQVTDKFLIDVNKACLW